MNRFYTLMCLLCGLIFSSYISNAQTEWPRTVTSSDGTLIKMYQWEPESLSGNTLKARAAISVVENGKSDPVFGVAWLTADVDNNGGQIVPNSVRIDDVKLPGEDDNDKLDAIQSSLESAMPGWNLSFSEHDLQAKLDLNKQQQQLASQISNKPPRVIYSARPSMLVLIDGEPKLQMNSNWNLEAVANSPFTIVKNRDGLFYLYGGKHWFRADSPTGPYRYVSPVPENLDKVAADVNEANKKNNNETADNNDNVIPDIIVSTEPAELIQSSGEANFSPIEGTGLLYVSNSGNDIFMDINSQDYYVLLAGRWYHSKTLKGEWEYIGPDKLPPDFARIPEGSPKDKVLASVAGTEQADDAVMNAQVPQTARVNRNDAKAEVTYDGEPEFQDIDGTDMDYAVNTPDMVIRWRGSYYCVDNGVWFQSYSALGPWRVCVDRPYVVALIPPRYPVYAMKYVYIYDVYPDYVYMGYTPGYLNAYIYGPTVVYGTGYYYRPWFHHYYYPRPWTWGFGMWYDPWVGWGFGLDITYGWFNCGWGYSYWPHWYSGWWGPSVYHPYCYDRGYRYRGYASYYGRGYYGGIYGRRNTYEYNRYSSNVYRYRRDVVTRDVPRRYNRPPGRIDYGRRGVANNNYNNYNSNFNRNSGNNYNRPSFDRNRSVPNNNRNYNRPSFDRNRPGNTNNSTFSRPPQRNSSYPSNRPGYNRETTRPPATYPRYNNPSGGSVQRPVVPNGRPVERAPSYNVPRSSPPVRQFSRPAPPPPSFHREAPVRSSGGGSVRGGGSGRPSSSGSSGGRPSVPRGRRG